MEFTSRLTHIQRVNFPKFNGITQAYVNGSQGISPPDFEEMARKTAAAYPVQVDLGLESIYKRRIRFVQSQDPSQPTTRTNLPYPNPDFIRATFMVKPTHTQQGAQDPKLEHDADQYLERQLANRKLAIYNQDFLENGVNYAIQKSFTPLQAQ